MKEIQVSIFYFVVALGVAIAGSCGHKSCPEDFELLDRRCFSALTPTPPYGTFKWEEARELCKAKGSGEWSTDLANIDVDVLYNFNSFIIDHITEAYSPTCWVGALKTDGEWRWLDGSPVNPMSYIWHMGFPTDDYMNYGLLQETGANGRFYLMGGMAQTGSPLALCEARLQIKS